MPLTENQVMRSRCAAQAIAVIRTFGRDPQQSSMDVGRLALAIWAVMSGQKEITDAIAKDIDEACAYALAAEALTASPQWAGGSLVR